MNDDYFKEQAQEGRRSAHIHMQASIESIADMVQNSAKFKPGDKVTLKRNSLKPYVYTVYTILGTKWSGNSIIYTLEYLGQEMTTAVNEDSLRFAPVNERRKLDL